MMDKTVRRDATGMIFFFFFGAVERWEWNKERALMRRRVTLETLSDSLWRSCRALFNEVVIWEGRWWEGGLSMLRSTLPPGGRTDRFTWSHRYYLIPSCPGLVRNQVKRYEMQPRRGDDVLGKKSPFACMFWQCLLICCSCSLTLSGHCDAHLFHNRSCIIPMFWKVNTRTDT